MTKKAIFTRSVESWSARDLRPKCQFTLFVKLGDLLLVSDLAKAHLFFLHFFSISRGNTFSGAKLAKDIASAF